MQQIPFPTQKRVEKFKQLKEMADQKDSYFPSNAAKIDKFVSRIESAERQNHYAQTDFVEP